MKVQFNPTHDEVRAMRAAAYPDIGDQLDAMFKLASAMEASGADLPAETRAWLEAVRKVKTTYPHA